MCYALGITEVDPARMNMLFERFLSRERKEPPDKMLNSQPMGFYAPAQLVQDARRHGVEILPVDVTISDRECTLTSLGSARLGLDMISGLSQADAERIVTARIRQPFEDIDDLSKCAMLDQRDLRLLANAGALATLAGHRRNAHWLATGVESLPRLSPQLRTQLTINAPIIEPSLQLKAPSEGEDI